MKGLVELYTSSRFNTQTLKSSTISCCEIFFRVPQGSILLLFKDTLKDYFY